jgi:hypothetical protein
MKEKLYEEVGAVYRFFLAWRHAALAGIVMIVGGAISLTASIYKESPELSFIVPLFACPFGFVLWMIDLRTRDLYHAAIRAGKNLEGEDKGFFSALSDGVALKKEESVFSRTTQSGALNIIFWAASIGLVLLAGGLFFTRTIKRTSRSSRPVPSVLVSGTVTNINLDLQRVSVPPGTGR